jgi:hypothetical protein
MNIPKGRHLSIIGHLLAHFVRSPESGVACSSVPFFFHHPLVLELDLGNFFHHFLMHNLSSKIFLSQETFLIVYILMPSSLYFDVA